MKGPRLKAVPATRSGEFLSRLALATFAVALLVRLIHVWQIRQAPFFAVLIGDARGYDQWAQRIAGGDWMGRDVFYQAPLYPYFLGLIYAVAGHSPLIVRLCQAVVGAAACVLLGLAARRFFSEREGMIAGLALALYAPAIFFDSLIQKSVLDVFFICLMLWIAAGILQHPENRRSWLALGLATGALALTRENALVFAVVIAAWAFVGPWMKVRGRTVRLKPDSTDGTVRQKPDAVDRTVRLKPDATDGTVRQKPDAVDRTVRLKPDATDGTVRQKPDAVDRTVRLKPDATDGTVRQKAGTVDRTVRLKPDATDGTVRQKPDAVDRTYTDVGSAFRRTAPFLLGLAIVLLPVAIRNYAVGGGFYLTTSQFGPNFFIGNNALADGTYRPLRPWRGAPDAERQDATELAERAAGRRLSPAEVSTYWTGRALTFITSQPGAWLRLLGRKLILLVNAAEMIDTESQETYAEWSWPVWLGGWIGHFGILVPLALFGAWILWPERRRLFLLYAMTAVYAASLLLFYVFARYRFPLVPLLMLFASAGVAAVPRVVRAASLVKKTVAFVALLAAITTANWPLVPAGFPQAVTENNLGIALQAEGRLDDATEHFQRAIAFRGDFAPAYNSIGLVLQAKGRSDEAIKSFERAIGAGPGYPDSYYNLGFELQARGEHEKAIERFREFIRLNQNDTNTIPANNRIGLSLLAQGRLDEAIAVFRASLARDAGNADALSGLADISFKQGRFEDAARQYREYAQRAPGDATAFHNLGLALVRQAKLAEAVDAFAQAVTLQPGNPAFHDDLGNALGSVGRLDEAAASYRRALELAPANVTIRNSLGLVLATQGKLQEALAEFRRSLELEPDNIQTRIDLETAMRIRR